MLLAYSPPPTPAAHDGDAPAVPELGAAEQLLLGLIAIPMLEEKLSCVRLVGSFRPRVQAVAQAAETLYDACKVRRNASGPWDESCGTEWTEADEEQPRTCTDLSILFGLFCLRQA